MSSSQGRRYRVGHVLGKGGFGTVYHAEMLGAGGFVRRVALKVLNPETTGQPEVARRLRDEARLLALLQHRAIVNVDGLVLLNGQWTVVMELLTGANLHQFKARLGKLPPGVSLEVAAEVASALHAAHQLPGPDGRPLAVLHRDIKPSNIQITHSGSVKVMDFGVARATFEAREAFTRSLIFGSLGYMAPERLAGRDTVAGDTYALGVVLFEILTGDRFGNACSRRGLHQSLVGQNLDPLADSLDPDVISLITATTAFDPEDRPSARDFERVARTLSRQSSDIWLPDWVEEHLPRVMEGTKAPGEGPLTGRDLVESLGDTIGPRPASPPAVAPREQAIGVATTAPQEAQATAPRPPPPGLVAEGPHQAPPPADSGSISLSVETGESTSWEPMPRNPEGSQPAAPTGPLAEASTGAAHRTTSGFTALLRPQVFFPAFAALFLGAAGGVWVLAPDRAAPGSAREAAASGVNHGDAGTIDASGASGAVALDAAGGAATPSLPSPALVTVPGAGGGQGESAPTQDAPATEKLAQEAPENRAQRAGAAQGATGHAAPAGEHAHSPGVDSDGSASTTRKAPSMGVVRLTGDDVTVSLDGPKGKFSPGRVPAGTYTASITFPGGEGLTMSSLRVEPGQTIELACNAAFQRCHVN